MKVIISEQQVGALNFIYQNIKDEPIFKDRLWALNSILIQAGHKPIFCLVYDKPIDKIEFNLNYSNACSKDKCSNCKMAVWEE